MIIGSCGYGATGSSVLTDLLREYDDIQVYDNFEFVIAYRVDGLQDLEYHLMKQYAKNSTGDYAIKRFLYAAKCYMTPAINKPCSGKKFYEISENFINNILQVSYKGVDTADMLSGNIMKNILAFASKKVFMPKVIEKVTKKTSYIWPCRTMYYSVEPENFYEEAKKYINNILEAMGVDLSRPVCLDQPFEGNAPQQSFPFFDDPYAVVIDRDPRDLYLAGKYTKDPNFKFTPKKNVDDFIIYYKNLRKNQKNDNQRILRVNFEDLIYCYEDSIKKIVSVSINVLENTPPELAADIVDKGVILTGGGSLLRGLQKVLKQNLKIPVLIAQSPLTCVVEGTKVLLDDIKSISKCV